MAWLRLSLSFDNICYVLSLVLNIAFGRRVLFTFSEFFFGDGFQSTLSDYFYNAGSFGTSDNTVYSYWTVWNVHLKLQLQGYCA